MSLNEDVESGRTAPSGAAWSTRGDGRSRAACHPVVVAQDASIHAAESSARSEKRKRGFPAGGRLRDHVVRWRELRQFSIDRTHTARSSSSSRAGRCCRGQRQRSRGDRHCGKRLRQRQLRRRPRAVLAPWQDSASAPCCPPPSSLRPRSNRAAAGEGSCAPERALQRGKASVARWPRKLNVADRLHLHVD